MSSEALITMLIGMAVIWGGLAAAIINAVRHTRAQRRQGPQD